MWREVGAPNKDSGQKWKNFMNEVGVTSRYFKKIFEVPFWKTPGSPRCQFFSLPSSAGFIPAEAPPLRGVARRALRAMEFLREEISSGSDPRCNELKSGWHVDQHLQQKVKNVNECGIEKSNNISRSKDVLCQEWKRVYEVMDFVVLPCFFFSICGVPPQKKGIAKRRCLGMFLLTHTVANMCILWCSNGLLARWFDWLLGPEHTGEDKKKKGMPGFCCLGHLEATWTEGLLWFACLEIFFNICLALWC